VRGILSARLCDKIRNDTMPSAPSSPVAKTNAKVRRQSTGKFAAHSAVRTAVVRFSAMRARGLKAADLNGKSDPYLKFQAVPFREYLVQPAYRSKVRKATLDPDWKYLDVPELHTVLRNNKQLKELVIAVSVWDHDVSSPDDPLGTVLIPIGSFVAPDSDADACTDIPPQKFNKRITLHGQQVHNGAELGYIRGMVSVTWQWDAGFGGDETREGCAVQ
jgi:Ca2+-dependent lipid-binding protein